MRARVHTYGELFLIGHKRNFLLMGPRSQSCTVAPSPGASGGELETCLEPMRNFSISVGFGGVGQFDLVKPKNVTLCCFHSLVFLSGKTLLSLSRDPQLGQRGVRRLQPLYKALQVAQTPVIIV